MREPALRFGVALVLAAVALLGGTAAAAPRTIDDRIYDCTIVASTREFPYGVDWNGAPGLDAWGQIVFLASTRTLAGESVTELRVGRGELDSHGKPRTHLLVRAGRTLANQPIGAFDLLSEAVLDDAARVVFRAYDPPTGGPPGIGIYRVFADHPTDVKPGPLYATEAIGGSFTSVGEIGGANAGNVVFTASTDQGTAWYRNGSVVAREGDAGIQTIVAPVLLHPFQPWVAFVGLLAGQQGGSAVVVDGTHYDQSTGLDETFTGLSLGGSFIPLAAYARSNVPGVGTWQLVRNAGIGAAVFVDADEDPFEPFAVPSETSVNTRGDVAFVAHPSGDGDTLLVADGGPVVHRVVCDDMQARFGTSVLFDVALGPRGMNGDGAIAFLARTPFLVPETGGFQTFLVRADPRPGSGALPTSCDGLADGTACDDGDPVTVATCAANACVADPASNPPASCDGLPDDTPCNDADPTTVSFCAGGQCVGIPAPVPEPGGADRAIAAAVALAAVRGLASRPR